VGVCVKTINVNHEQGSEPKDLDIREETIRSLKKQLEESKKREPAGALANGDITMVDMTSVQEKNNGGNYNANAYAGAVEVDVSSLGTVLTASAAGLLKDAHFTAFVNRKVFRYAKYWVPVRDAPPDSALANYFRSQWYGDYVERGLGRHPCFDDWWVHNGLYIRQRLNQKRTNNIGQLRKVFKGMFVDGIPVKMTGYILNLTVFLILFKFFSKGENKSCDEG
jgi:hypothetical protein